MLIKRISRLTGKTHTREINVTQEQIDAWRGGEYIQKAMPHLSVNDREFLMTGLTPEEWDQAFGEEE